MWPTGMAGLGIDASGKIGPELSAEPGRALGRLTDLGWGPRLRGLLADEGGDGAVPDDLIAAVVKVLAAWDWEQRPAGVVTLPSRTRPQLVESLGRRIAEIGQIPYLGGLAYTGAAAMARPARQYNSAQRLAALWRELTVPDALGGEIAGLGGPVLLVDDRVETGWTMTVAAKLLREAGGVAVLPLVLAASS
jgi:ATP-dependent DNA helicase RecQ